nr:putative reverse transcriptase domain-containing protein [Tanacetum cinerariifolium]
MPPRITTQSAGRSTAGPRGVEANGGVDRVLNFSIIIAQQFQNLLPTILAEVGNLGTNKGINRNQNGDAINDNIQGDVRNVIMNNDRRGYTYKEFLACHQNKYNVKGGNATYTDRFHDLARLVPRLVTPENRRNERGTLRGEGMMESLVEIGMGRLIIKGLGLGMLLLQSLTRSFARDYKMAPRMVNPVNARNLNAAHGACFECGGTDHFKAAYLMPIELGSFDAVIGMDWLRRHHAMIVCDEKLIRVPFGNETLISATREDDKSEGKQVKDVPIIQDFPKVFSENLP